jgi:hypothetical protein
VYVITGTTGSLWSFFVPLPFEQAGSQEDLSAQSEDRYREHRAASHCIRDRGLDYELPAQAVDAGRAVHVEVTLGEGKSWPGPTDV